MFILFVGVGALQGVPTVIINLLESVVLATARALSTPDRYQQIGCLRPGPYNVLRNLVSCSI